MNFDSVVRYLAKEVPSALIGVLAGYLFAAYQLYVRRKESVHRLEALKKIEEGIAGQSKAMVELSQKLAEIQAKTALNEKGDAEVK